MFLVPGSMRRRNTAPDSAPATHRVPSYRGGTASAVSRGPGGRPPAAGHPSVTAMSHHLLDFADSLGGLELLRARLGAIHDGVTAVQAEGILQMVQPLTGSLITAIDAP